MEDHTKDNARKVCRWYGANYVGAKEIGEMIHPFSAVPHVAGPLVNFDVKYELALRVRAYP